MKDAPNQYVKYVPRDQIVTIGDLEKLKQDLLEEFKKLLDTERSHAPKSWLRTSQVRKILNVSQGTLHNLRITRKLPFSKIGSIVYYKSEDVYKLLEENKSKWSNG